MMNTTIGTLIRGVVFDMDGLMFDTETLAIDGWISAGRQFGWPMTSAMVINTIGISRPDTEKYLQETLGPGFDYARLSQAMEDYMDAHVAEYGVPLKPGLLDLLTYLKDNGFLLAVASSSPIDHIHHLLERAEVGHFFSAVISADMVTNGKPAPDIYQAACSALELDPSQCLALEDSLAGIRSAHAAGLRPIMIPDLIPPDESVAELVFAQYQQLNEVISGLEALAATEIV